MSGTFCVDGADCGIKKRYGTDSLPSEAVPVTESLNSVAGAIITAARMKVDTRRVIEGEFFITSEGEDARSPAEGMNPGTAPPLR